jgi:MFS family permease
MLVIGMLVFGMGMNAAQQLRVAATDMFPPQLRAQALGYVALGSLVGLLVSPLMVGGAEALALRTGQDPLALPWLMLPVLIIGGMLVVIGVRPDPKEIGMNLAHYYPGYTPAKPSGVPGAKFSASDMLRDGPTRLAIVANCSGQGNMSIVMVLTSLVLHHHGHSLTAIAVSHMFHSAGMFGFTVWLGKLADRFGRTSVMMPGVATTLIGAGLVTFTPAYWSVTLGTFLVGLGWAASNVAATALIADNAPTEHRGRAIGFNDSCAGGISVVTAIITGPLIEWYGLPGAGIAAVLVAAIPLLMWPATRSRTSEVS